MSINSLNGKSGEEIKFYVKDALYSGTSALDLLDKEYLANNEYGLPKDSSSDKLCSIFEEGKTILDFSVSDAEFADNTYYSYDNNGNSLYYSDARAVIKNPKDGYSFSVVFDENSITQDDLEQYSLNELREMGKIEEIQIMQDTPEGKIAYNYCFNDNGETLDTSKTLEQRGEKIKTLYSREYGQSGALESKMVDTEGDGIAEYQYSPKKEEISSTAESEDFVISEYSKNISTILQDAYEEVNIENSLGQQDGVISDMYQRGVGDCWLIASLKSLSLSDGGAQMIKNAIKNNEDGSYTVSLPGINTQYTVTTDEIVNRRQSNTCSTGDIDAIIIELAFEKARGEKEPVLNAIRNFTYDISKFFKRGGGNETPLTFGNLSDVIKYFTGEKVTYVINTPFTKSGINDFYEKFQNNPENTVAVAHFLNLNPNEKDLKAEESGGGNISLTDFGMHVFSIKSVDEDTVRIIDPSNTGNWYEISKEELRDKVAYIEYYQF